MIENWLSVKPVLSWSDVLIYVLVLSIGLFFRQLRKHPLARARWRSVYEPRAGMASLDVIVFYVLMAMLDSIQYREPLRAIDEQESVHDRQDVRSALDCVLQDLRPHD